MNTIPILLPPGRQPVRIFVKRPDHDPVPFIPLIDVAAAIKVNRTTRFYIIKRNPKVFAGWVELVDVTSTNSEGKRGNQQLTCTTREGLIGLLVKLSCDRVKDPVAQEKIITFQRWAIKTLTAILEGKPPEQPFDLTDCLSLPEGRVRAQALRRIAQERGLSRSTINKYFRQARLAAGLSVSTRRHRCDAGSMRNEDAKRQLLVVCYHCKKAGVEPTKSRMRAFMRAAGITYSISTAYRCTAEVREAKHRPGRGFLAAVQQLLDQPTHVNPTPTRRPETGREQSSRTATVLQMNLVASRE